MSTVRPFQIGIVGVFGVLAVIALIILTTYQAQKTEEEEAYGERVVIWGTVSQNAFAQTFESVTTNDKAFLVVEYQQFDPDYFDFELVNAIAEGRSPDIVVLSSNALTTHRSKLIPISAETITDRYFRDTYVDGAEIFKFEEGIYGIPFAVDPLMMYWNRDTLGSNGFAQAPLTWDSLVTEFVPRLTVRDTNRNIIKSALAFGEFANVTQAKGTLILLALQTGSKMVVAQKERYEVALNESVTENAPAPFEAAVQFYTDFSNAAGPRYSWNRAMDNDQTEFLGGDLSIYFGLGSEYEEIAQKNPNLNFDIARVPQGQNATALRTYGEFYAFAIPKASKNPQGAFAVANILTTKDTVALLTHELNLAPVRRDLVSVDDENAYRRVIIESAIIARGWLDPGDKESIDVFTQMVEDVVSNRLRVGDAVGDAIDRLILAY